MRNIEELKRFLKLDGQELPNLQIALTHRSYAVEHKLAFDNQRLEFLGDAVLEIILTEYLYQRYPDFQEGEMTKIRAALVREKALAILANSIELGSYLLLGKGESECGGDHRQSTVADLFESVLGALYLDAGFEYVRTFVLEMVRKHFPDPQSLLETSNPKGQLQELIQKRHSEPPQYTILRVSGPEHQPNYEVEVTVGKYTALGSAGSRKLAESAAAREMLSFLLKKGEVSC